MFAIDQSLSLFIPRVFNNIQKLDIMRIFKSLGLGVVEHVDFVAKKGKNGLRYNAAYIHFSHWFDTITTANFQEKVLTPSKEARVVYDDPWYWIALPNTNYHCSPPQQEWFPSYGFSFQSDCQDRLPFNGKDWLKKCGFTGLPIKDLGMTDQELNHTIQSSKFARDTANQEILNLRDEIEKSKKLIDEITHERDDAKRKLEFTSEQNDYYFYENENIKYELAEKENELYCTVRANQELSGEIKNLKDELQASYMDNDTLEEENERLKTIISELKGGQLNH
jgi:hypothetical protein